jgi:hypothetical protein
LKAIDIINFINEDKFSKYTVKQIYDELGHEEFVNYIETVSSKIVKNMNPKYGLNPKCIVTDDKLIIIWGYYSDAVSLTIRTMLVTTRFKFSVFVECNDGRSGKFHSKETIIDLDKQNISNELNIIFNNDIGLLWKKLGLK